MTYEFKVQRRVEFCETDMAGIVHFANYFRYMESVEHAFFRSLGLSIHDGGETMEGWARVNASCDFFAPLRYPEVFEVRLLVAEMRSRSITYIGEVYKEGRDEPAARARWTVVRVRREPGDETLRSAEIPRDVASKLSVAPPQRLPQDTKQPSNPPQEA